MDGVYRIYARKPDGYRRLMGRLAITDGLVHHLEDHHGSLEGIFPEGPVSPRTAQRLHSFSHSPYYEIVDEENINAGHHTEDIPDLEIGDVTPEATFTLAGEGLAAPQLVEVWHGAVVVAGRKLSEGDVHELMGKVRDGTLILTPVE